jgi:FkbM family methyltransferase
MCTFEDKLKIYENDNQKNNLYYFKDDVCFYGDKMNISYSQLGQDLYILNQYNFKQNGFFVEVGSSDGITISNTYLLEKEYGWKGICVEPLPYYYETCIKNRPNSVCCKDAVYSENDLILEFNIAGCDLLSTDGDLLSGITSHIDKYVDTLKKGIKINVTTKTLNSILDKYNAPKFIDYLSIDTEGSELEVLKGIDFDKYKFGMIDIEHNYVEPRRTQMKEFLLFKGYKYNGENRWDDRYRL